MRNAHRVRRFKSVRTYLAGRKVEREHRQEERRQIRAEEEARAVQVAERNRVKRLRQSERTRAEGRAGVAMSPLEERLVKSRSRSTSKKPRGKKKGAAAAAPKPQENPFFGSAANDVIFGGSGSKTKHKKTSFDEFKRFDEVL